jgi:hypothetical protein
LVRTSYLPRAFLRIRRLVPAALQWKMSRVLISSQ